MYLHHNLQRNKKGIGTVFGMVFFLLIVMLVFASFMIILNQNTGLEQVVIKAKQMNLDRYTELETISIMNPEVAVLNNIVYVSCSVANNGTLTATLVRFWIEDVTNHTIGNTIAASSIYSTVLQPGSSTYYFNSAEVANASSSDQFIFWFVTARGNIISAYPDINQFNGITYSGTFPGVTDINSTYNGEIYHPLQLSLTTTKSNQLIYVVVSYDDENTLYTPTSTPSLTWTMRSQSLDTDYGYFMDGDSTLETFYAIKPSPGPVQINIQSTADELSDYYCSALAFAISDVNTTAPFDGLAQTTVGKSTMPQDTITTHYSNELIIGAISIDSLYPAINPGAGFAEIMPVQSSYGATGEPDAQPRSVWSEWAIIDAPRTNLPVNCTFTSTKNWAIIVDAVRLVVIPPTTPVSLSPTSGPSGQPVTVSGQGFAANSRLIATFDGSQIPFSFTTDGSGNIPPGATFTVPQGSSAGNKTVTIIDSKFNYASANFTVTTSSITLSPQIGPVGTSVTVTGSNFISNSPITINFNGNLVATNPSTVIADATGSFSATFNASATAGGKQVLASDGVNSAYANFNVTPSITVTPNSGLSGVQVTVSGQGFAANSNLMVTFDGTAVTPPPTNAVTDATGSFYNLIFAPQSSTPGPKIVNVTDASGNFNSTIFNLMLIPNVPAPTLIPVSPIVLGTSIRGSVTVTGASGFTPTGTITFKVSTDSGNTWNAFGAVKTLVSGSATSDSYTPQTVGVAYQFMAIYYGDSNYVSSTGAASGILTVNRGTASVSASSFVPVSPITLGSSVTVSASVSAPSGVTTVPTGTVQFQVRIGAGSYANFGFAVALSSGSAAISYTPSAIGTYSFQAIYQGDSNYVAGTTGAASGILTVYIPSTTGTVLSASSPITLGGTTTDTATVTPQTYLYNQVIYVAAGTGVSGTGASLSVGYPSTFAANDLFLVQVTVRDTTNAPTMPSEWSLLYGPDSSGTGRQWIYYKFATGSETGTLSVTFTGSNLKIARMYDFRNVAASSFTESASFGPNAGSNTISAQPVTTADVNRLAVSFVFDTYSNTLSPFSGSFGGTWAEPVLEYTTTSSSRGGVQLQTATMPSAGTISGGSLTLSTSASWGVRAFALIPSAALATGNVNFQVLAPGGSWTTYNTKTLVSGGATSDSYKPTSVGTWYFRAVYAGDANYVGSQSVDDAESLVVNAATATVGAATFIPASPIVLSITETVSATVSGPSGVTAPTGNVQFQVSISGGTYTNFGSPVPLAGGSASISYIAQAPTTYQFQAVYLGDGNYNGASGAASGILTVNKGTASVSASSFAPASPITLGSSVTVSASVSGTGGVPDPTGNVQFQVKIGAGSFANFGSAVALSGGSASISYTPSSVNTYNFQAFYQGDSNYNSGTTGATSGTLNIKVNPTVPAPTLNPVSPITLGSSLTASVTVTGSAGTPTGTITFQVSTDSGSTWSSLGVVKTLVSGSATSDSYTPLSVSSNYMFRAVYNGDGNYYGATGAATSLTVKATSGVPAPIVNPNLVVVGNVVTVSVTVSGVSGVPTPTGTATFQVKIGAGSFTTIGSAVTLVNGAASTTYTPATINSYQFQVIYSGDSNYNGATSSATSLTVSSGQFGNNQQQGSGSNTIENTITGGQFICTDSGTAQSITAYIIVSSTHTIKAAIYTTSGTLVGSTTENSVTTSNDGWVTFSFSGTKPALTAGTSYVLVVWANNPSGNAYLYYSSTTGGTPKYYSNTYASTWPSPVTFTSGNVQYSIYCTYSIP